MQHTEQNEVCEYLITTLFLKHIFYNIIVIFIRFHFLKHKCDDFVIKNKFLQLANYSM